MRRTAYTSVITGGITEQENWGNPLAKSHAERLSQLGNEGWQLVSQSTNYHDGLFIITSMLSRQLPDPDVLR
jgi:hypothetical protein